MSKRPGIAFWAAQDTGPPPERPDPVAALYLAGTPGFISLATKPMGSSTDNERTLVIDLQSDVNAADKYICNLTTGTNDSIAIGTDSTKEWGHRVRTASGTSVNKSSAVGEWSDLARYRIMLLGNSNPANFRLFRDAVEQTETDTPGLNIGNTPNGYSIGRRNSSTGYWLGYIFSFLMFDRVLDAQDQAEVWEGKYFGFTGGDPVQALILDGNGPGGQTATVINEGTGGSAYNGTIEAFGTNAYWTEPPINDLQDPTNTDIPQELSAFSGTSHIDERGYNSGRDNWVLNDLTAIHLDIDLSVQPDQRRCIYQSRTMTGTGNGTGCSYMTVCVDPRDAGIDIMVQGQYQDGAPFRDRYYWDSLPGRVDLCISRKSGTTDLNCSVPQTAKYSGQGISGVMTPDLASDIDRNDTTSRLGNYLDGGTDDGTLGFQGKIYRLYRYGSDVSVSGSVWAPAVDWQWKEVTNVETYWVLEHSLTDNNDWVADVNAANITGAGSHSNHGKMTNLTWSPVPSAGTETHYLDLESDTSFFVPEAVFHDAYLAGKKLTVFADVMYGVSAGNGTRAFLWGPGENANWSSPPAGEYLSLEWGWATTNYPQAWLGVYDSSGYAREEDCHYPVSNLHHGEISQFRLHIPEVVSGNMDVDNIDVHFRTHRYTTNGGTLGNTPAGGYGTFGWVAPEIHGICWFEGDISGKLLFRAQRGSSLRELWEDIKAEPTCKVAYYAAGSGTNLNDESGNNRNTWSTGSFTRVAY